MSRSHSPPFPATAAESYGGNLRDRGEYLKAKTDETSGEQGEELARLETYALDVDFPGWAAEERGAKSMSTRSFVTRQRDHRRDRGKSVSNAMVNDVSETERDAKKKCIRTSLLVFSSLVSKRKIG